jgi:hypothetical protein
MRRHPSKHKAPDPGALPGLTSPLVPPNAPQPQPPVPRGRQLTAQQAGNRQEAFLRSGGLVFFPVITEEGFEYDPRPAGYQLVTHYYVPKGRVAWVKQLRIAPFMPPVFAFDQAKAAVVGGAAQMLWPSFNPTQPSPTEAPLRPSGHAGVWETPFGWEAYADFSKVPFVPIVWRWELRIVRGDALRGRKPWDPTDPATWFMCPDVPVPPEAYPGGLPGNPPEQYAPQRMQVLQSDELTAHVFVPENSTICLFVEWSQEPVTPTFATDAGALQLAPYAQPAYPLLPSFGQLSGYQQAIDRAISMKNAIEGWQG